MLELDFQQGPEIAPVPFWRTSNGLASGNCREEALLHALCELVERHSFAVAEGEPERRVPVLEDSVDAPGCRELIGRIRAAGMKLAIRDMTCELGLPAFLVDIVAPDFPQAWRGMGCHTCPAIALSRALTESAQSRLTHIAGSRDDLHEPVVGDMPFAAFEEFVEPRGARAFPDVADLSAASVAADVDRVVERLAGQGLEAFWVDLTRPEIGLPVVFAFIPGLREPVH
jgi:ribosomal protein S12 methylthiotransferase accessory factor